MPEAISAAAHAGNPDAGEPFTGAWTHGPAARARRFGSTMRSAVAHLPETLDGPASTPAASGTYCRSPTDWTPTPTARMTW